MTQPRYVSYYNLHGSMDHGFLHPGGRLATERLLSLLPPLPDKARIVEVGCGVGETAELMLERFQCSYAGIDASPKMVERSRERLRRFGDRAEVIECDLRERDFPYEDESVDCIIAESVFAILDPRIVFQMCRRLLKPGGIVAWNDRIWGNNVLERDRAKINLLSDKIFGFHAAPGDLLGAADWVELAKRAGFAIVSTERVTLHTAASKQNIFARFARLLAFAARPGILTQLIRDEVISKRYKGVWESMENWMFVARKA